MSSGGLHGGRKGLLLSARRISHPLPHKEVQGL